jgi:hypothetical protein
VAGNREPEEKMRQIASALYRGAYNALIDESDSIMSKALQRVPYDTGELARSARVEINGKLVIKGAGPLGDFTTKRLRDSEPPASAPKSGTIRSTLSFQKMRDYFDVALFTHEYIYPYSSQRHPHARQEGRGPKYLEAPLRSAKRGMINRIREKVNQALNRIK